jgi:hypothetical protein
MMMTNVSYNKYYTYIHYKADTLEPFYIGKGKDNRYLSTKDRNQYWKNVNNKHGSVSEILSVFKDEKDAFDHEKFLISTFRDLGYKLVNLTDGGEGCSGRTYSKETKDKIRIAKIGNQNATGSERSQETRDKIREANLGKKRSKETIEKFSKAQKGIKSSKFKGYILATKIDTGKVYTFCGNRELIDYGFNSSKVYACLSGRRKTHKGYSFKRVEINEHNITPSTNTDN